MSVFHEHCSSWSHKYKSPAYLLDNELIYFRMPIFFNIIETLQMTLGPIGDVLSGPAAPGQP